MKKTVLSAIATIALTTSLSAEVKPYIGIGYNSFAIHNSGSVQQDTSYSYSYSYRSLEDKDYKGSTIGLNGGVILTNNTKINLSFFTGKEDDIKQITASVLGVSYDYSFNNYGTRKGWYIGGGLSSVTIEFDETSGHTASSESSTGLLLKGGLEYQSDNNFLFDIGYSLNFTNKIHEFKGKNQDGTTNDAETWYTEPVLMPVFNISVSYLF
jgi:outer membrane protein W